MKPSNLRTLLEILLELQKVICFWNTLRRFIIKLRKNIVDDGHAIYDQCILSIDSTNFIENYFRGNPTTTLQERLFISFDGHFPDL